MDNNLKFVGIVHSGLKSLDECPKQSDDGNAPDALIEIFLEYREGLQDIRSGAEILLITWLHMANRNTLTCHPQDDLRNPLTGVFSTRSADRPNPLGLHYVKVIDIPESGILRIDRLEVIDKTPVVDIKPVLRWKNKSIF